MGAHAIIPAAVTSSISETQRLNQKPYTPATLTTRNTSQSRKESQSPSDNDSSGLTIRNVSYGSTESASGSASYKGKEPAANGLKYDEDHSDDEDEDEEDEEDDEDCQEEDCQGEQEGEEELGPVIDVTWRYMSRLYLLVPIITLLWLAVLSLLVTYAWPPSDRERKAGQQYPHPFLFKPFAIGIFASCTVQTIRVPIWEVVSWLGVSTTAVTFLSTISLTIIHELLRFSTIPLVVHSPTSGFHSTYYLGLGWGVAEVTWGIVQGWEQLALYKDVMKPEPASASTDLESQRLLPGGRPEDSNLTIGLGLSVVTERSDEDDEQVIDDDEEEQEQYEDEAELERKVEILERMRARRDLEDVLGLPFPNIPFPLHLLWRLDTLLLNLGLTLFLAAYYYNPTPIYRHTATVVHERLMHDTPARTPDAEPSQYVWLVWALIAGVHVAVSLVWKVVGRVGVGAVTWGGLIVALGSVFAGLGAWGGLV